MKDIKYMLKRDFTVSAVNTRLHTPFLMFLGNKQSSKITTHEHLLHTF